MMPINQGNSKEYKDKTIKISGDFFYLMKRISHNFL